jgi:hypothetical protein
MITPSEQVELGLEMLQDRRRALGKPVEITQQDRDRIAGQIARAQEPWSRTCELLVDHPEIVAILRNLWPQVLPYLIKGNEISPVHHIAYVVRFMARIGLSELPQRELKPGLVAALLHDIGIGDCALPKISEASIERATPEQRVQLRRDGIESRLEHMRKGVQISSGLLTRYQREYPVAFSVEEINLILDIVGTHDYSKIPLMEDHVDRKWLLTPTGEDWLKQCHWEADALWMLSPAGILIDLEREREADTPANRKTKFDFNLGLHRQIITLYAMAYSPDEMQQFGFKDGLLYRSNTGYQIAMQFQRQSEE